MYASHLPVACTKPDHLAYRETDIDDVVQVNNVFINVSKGEVAKTEDLKKAFGSKATTESIVREVTPLLDSLISYNDTESDSSTRRDSGWGKGTRARALHLMERDCHIGLREMR